MDGLLDQRVAQKAESKSKTWMKVPGSFLICVPKWKSTDISMALPPGPAGKYVIFSWTSASFFSTHEIDRWFFLCLQWAQHAATNSPMTEGCSPATCNTDLCTALIGLFGLSSIHPSSIGLANSSTVLGAVKNLQTNDNMIWKYTSFHRSCLPTVRNYPMFGNT